MTHHSHWFFTLNNPEEDPEAFLSRLKSDKKVRYVIFQKERGEENQTDHYQGYLELTRNQRMSYVKRLMPRAHLEIRKGTRDEARDYCRKEKTRIDGPWEAGQWNEKGQGCRNDLLTLRDDTLGRKRPRGEICRSCNNNQQLRFVEGLTKYIPIRANFQPKNVVWCYGKSGAGKTRYVMEFVKDKDYYMADTAKWMDGYYGQDYVVMDELRAKDWPYARLLKLLDGYEILTAVKGGYVIWHPSHIFITTPFNPMDTYYLQAQVEGGIEQLMRRIVEVKLFGPENRRETVLQITPSTYVLEHHFNNEHQ